MRLTPDQDALIRDVAAGMSLTDFVTTAAVLLGRLYVHRRAHSSSLGRLLVRAAVISTLAAADRVGVRPPIVHDLHEEAADARGSACAPPLPHAAAAMRLGEAVLAHHLHERPPYAVLAEREVGIRVEVLSALPAPPHLCVNHAFALPSASMRSTARSAALANLHGGNHGSSRLS